MKLLGKKGKVKARTKKCDLKEQDKIEVPEELSVWDEQRRRERDSERGGFTSRWFLNQICR